MEEKNIDSGLENMVVNGSYVYKEPGMYAKIDLLDRESMRLACIIAGNQKMVSERKTNKSRNGGNASGIIGGVFDSVKKLGRFLIEKYKMIFLKK